MENSSLTPPIPLTFVTTLLHICQISLSIRNKKMYICFNAKPLSKPTCIRKLSTYTTRCLNICHRFTMHILGHLNACYTTSVSYIAKHFIESLFEHICNDMLLLFFFKLYILGMIWPAWWLGVKELLVL